MLPVEYLENKIKELKRDISKFEKSEVGYHKEYVTHLRRLLEVYERGSYASNDHISDYEGYDGLDEYDWFRANKKNGEFI